MLRGTLKTTLARSEVASSSIATIPNFWQLPRSFEKTTLALGLAEEKDLGTPPNLFKKGRGVFSH